MTPDEIEMIDKQDAEFQWLLQYYSDACAEGADECDDFVTALKVYGAWIDDKGGHHSPLSLQGK